MAAAARRVAQCARHARPAAGRRSPCRTGSAMNGFIVACRPSRMPMAAGRHLGRDVETRRRSWPRRRRGRGGGDCRHVEPAASEIDSGRPTAGHAVQHRRPPASMSTKSDTTCSTPMPISPRAAGDADQLVVLGGERRRGLALAGAVVERARRGEAEAAGLHAFGGEPAHVGDLVGAWAARCGRPARP